MRKKNFSDLSKCTIRDLIDVDYIQELQNSLAKSYGIGICMADAAGTMVTVPSNYDTFCTEVVRKTERGCELCRESIFLRSKDVNEAINFGLCNPAGLMDAGVPIVVGGVRMATWLMGQVVDADDDYSDERLNERAIAIGADPEEFIREFRKLPCMSKEKFISVADSVRLIANHIAALGLSNYSQRQELSYRKELERQLHHQNEHDALTNLYNRYFYEKKITELILLDTTPVSVVAIDANFLKLSNDIFGHTEGDCLLQLISGALVEEAKDNYFCCRCGGDEFYVIMVGVDAEEATDYAKRIKARSREDYCTVIPPSFSCGVATKYFSQENLVSIIKQAEDRMYLEKTSMKKSGKILDTIRRRLFDTGYLNESDDKEFRDLTLDFAKYLNISAQDMDILEKLTMLENLGMITVPHEILENADENIDYELESKYMTSNIEYRISMMFDETSPAAKYVAQRTEEWDGTGRPNRIMKDRISLPNRIIKITEFYARLVARKPHGSGLKPEDALESVLKKSGTSFDPDIVDKFAKYINSNERR